jgi:hypothetical protein
LRRKAPAKAPDAAASLFFRVRPDAIVRRLPVHGGSRIAFDLAGYVVNDGQLLDTRWKRIRNRFVGSHF